ncbi:hypothetical protein UlMin_016086 [Ulmus minor]
MFGINIISTTDMLSHNDYYCLKQEPQSVTDVLLLAVTIVTLFVILLFIVPVGFFFRKLEVNYKRIVRESKLLEALARDFEKVYGSVEQINKEANIPVWDLGIDPREITQPLNKIETEWVKISENVRNEAKLCVDDFEQLKNATEDFRRRVLLIKNCKGIYDLYLNMKRTCEEIDNQLVGEEKVSSRVCKTLEESRNAIRSLPKRSIDKNESGDSRHKFDFIKKLPSDLKGFFDQKQIGGMGEQVGKVLMQVEILNNFVRDLRFLKLESEIEKAWLMGAKDILTEVDKSMVAINRMSEEAAKRRWPWPWPFSWNDELKRSIEDFDSGFSQLLLMKERYGFTFISSKSAHSHSQQQSMDEIDVCLDRIGTQLGVLQTGSKVHAHNSVTLSPEAAAQLLSSLTPLCKQLKNTQLFLKEQRKTEEATHTIDACFQLLRQTASDLENSFNAHRSSPQANSQFQILRFKLAADLLQRTGNAFSIKVMKDLFSVVGLEEDVHELVQTLTANNQNISTISIVGMEGVGKTTLAKKIYGHITIMKVFDVFRFVTLRPEQESDEITLLQSVGNQLLKTEDQAGTDRDYWIRKIQDFLREKPYLLVLDNLSFKESWDKLKSAFQGTTNGSKIMITTRNKAVALQTNGKIHQLLLRSKNESYEFFTQMVPWPSDKEVKRSTKRVVARTGGLPLAILRLRCVLSSKRSVFKKESATKEELLRELELVDQGLNPNPWKENLKINKDELQPQSLLGKCLSLLEYFPRDSEIPARRLVALWAACEQLQNGDEERNQNKADKILKDLIDLNMIQIVQRKRNRNVKTCCFPSTLRELWLKERGKNNIAPSWSLCASSDQKLAYCFDDKDASYSHSIDGLGTNSSSVCPVSLMFFDTREGEKPGKDIGNYLITSIDSGTLGELQVLDLEGVFRPKLPKSIKKLKRLVYLGLRWTDLETLPQSVGKLLHLQTLDLKHTRITELPCSIWKLEELQHLYLDQNSSITSMPKHSAISTEKLETLSGVLVEGKGSALISALEKFRKLQKLGLTLKLTPQQQKELAKQIEKLIHLKSLSLRSINHSGETLDLILGSVSLLNNLNSLYLFGKLNMLCIDEPPMSLTRLSELTLSATGLTEDPMPKLGKLLNLKFLSFFKDSYKEKDMNCDSVSFPKLLVLQLWNLDSLENLKVERGAMKKIGEIEIRDCRNLKVPSGLTHLQTLQELKLTNMPKTYEADVRMVYAEAADQHSGSSIHPPPIKTKKF